MRNQVRFYTSSTTEEPVRAVLHHSSCHWPEPGKQMTDGWWQSFNSSEEARRAAVSHVLERRQVEGNPDLNMTLLPGCCT